MSAAPRRSSTPPATRACAASSTFPRSPRASRSFRLWLVQGALRARRRRLRARLDDRPAARGLWPRRPRDVRIVQDGAAGPRSAAAQGPLLGHPCRGSCAGSSSLWSRRPPRSARPTSPTTAPKMAGSTAISRARSGRVFGKRATTLAMPKAMVKGAAAPRPARPPLEGEADPRPRPLLLPPRLGRRRRRRPPATLWTPPSAPHRPQGHGRMVSGAGLAPLKSPVRHAGLDPASIYFCAAGEGGPRVKPGVTVHEIGVS